MCNNSFLNMLKQQSSRAVAFVATISLILFGTGIGFFLDQGDEKILNELEKKNKELLATDADARLTIRQKEQELAVLNATLVEGRRNASYAASHANAATQHHAQSQELLKYKNERITRQVEEYKELSKKYAMAMTELFVLHQSKNKVDKDVRE